MFGRGGGGGLGGFLIFYLFIYFSTRPRDEEGGRKRRTAGFEGGDGGKDWPLLVLRSGLLDLEVE